jgi:hypothetical protein
VDGRRDAEGKSWLLLDVEGAPELRCQRCLGGLRHELRIKSRLQLVGPGEEWPDEDLADDSADAIEAEKNWRCCPWWKMKCCWRCPSRLVTNSARRLRRMQQGMDHRRLRRWPL